MPYHTHTTEVLLEAAIIKAANVTSFLELKPIKPDAESLAELNHLLELALDLANSLEIDTDEE